MRSSHGCSVVPIPGLRSCVATVICSSVRAAEPETADQLVAKGVELRKKGDHAGALREFQAAHEKEPSGRTLAQMGIAEATLQRWVDAENHLSQALESTMPWVEKNRATLEQTLQTVRTHTAEISIYGTTGAVVTVGDKMVGRIPLPSSPLVNEGTVTIKVESRGHKPFVADAARQGRRATDRDGHARTVAARVAARPLLRSSRWCPRRVATAATRCPRVARGSGGRALVW